MNCKALVLAAGLSLVTHAACSPLVAQEELSFSQEARGVREGLMRLERQLNDREVELGRHLEILDQLTEGAGELARSAPRTGRDAALAAIEAARELAAIEPPLDGEVFAILDRCRAEVEHSVFGETGPGAAARLLARVLVLEESANESLRRLLVDVGVFRQIDDLIDMGANAHLAKSSQALDRLYRLHAVGLALREPR
jgi:hypothetical protein